MAKWVDDKKYCGCLIIMQSTWLFVFSIEWLAIQRENSHVQRTRLCKQSGERMIYINSNQRLNGYMDAETKWPPFSWRFQVHFLEWKFMNFHWNFTEVCLKGPINTIPALVQIMAWCRSCAKTLSEPMMVSLLKHVCVTRPQWVKHTRNGNYM